MRNVITGDDGPWCWMTGNRAGDGRSEGTVLCPRTVYPALGDAINRAPDAVGRCP